MASPIPTSPSDQQISIILVGGINASHVSAETLQTPQKTREKLPIIMCYVCSKKCRMLTLTFLRDSYVTWEQRRLQITKFQAFGGLLGTFGGHFGSILGTFLAHFGSLERTWKHIAYKRGGHSFGVIILGPKNGQN